VKNLKLVLALLVLSLAMLACGASTAITSMMESGSITFIDPNITSPITEDYTGVPGNLPVTILSTFDAPKEARLSTGAHFWTCTLVKGNNPCPPAVLDGPGTHVIRAELYKLDGTTIVSTQTTVTWTPYSKLDKLMKGIYGTESPIPGYGTIIFFIACLAALAFGKIFGSQWGAILAFFMSLIGLAVFFQQSGSSLIAGQVLTLIYGIIAAAFTTFVIITWIKNRGSVHVYPKVTVTDGNKTIEMSELFYLGDSEHGPDLGRMGDSASRQFLQPPPQAQYYFPPNEALPQLEDPRQKKKGFLGWR
jgi:hypothetical protein